MVTTQNATRKQSKSNQQPANLFDEELVNAIRQGKIVSVRWKDLTEAERVAARNAMFRPCGF